MPSTSLTTKALGLRRLKPFLILYETDVSKRKKLNQVVKRLDTSQSTWRQSWTLPGGFSLGQTCEKGLALHLIVTWKSLLKTDSKKDRVWWPETRITFQHSHSPSCAAVESLSAWWCWRSVNMNRKHITGTFINFFMSPSPFVDYITVPLHDFGHDCGLSLVRCTWNPFLFSFYQTSVNI